MSAPEHAGNGSEDRAEQLDRNLIELLNELRVSGTGIQVLLAFLLIVPFNSGYKRLSSFDKHLYFLALLCIAAAAVCLIAPSIHHRLLFRHGQRPFIIWLANRFAIVGMAFLAAGLTAILALIGNVVFGTAAALVVGIGSGCVLGGVWFAVPLARRSKPPER